MKRKLNITKTFSSVNDKSLVYDVLSFRDGKYFVLYEEEKLFSVNRPLVILETYYNSWGEKKFAQLDKKARKLTWELPFNITCQRTGESYEKVSSIIDSKREEEYDESKVEAIGSLDRPNDYAIFGLIADWDSSREIKSYWYVFGKKNCLMDGKAPFGIVIWGNNEFPTTKEYAEKRLQKIFSKAGKSLEIKYPEQTYDEFYAVKKENLKLSIDSVI